MKIVNVIFLILCTICLTLGLLDCVIDIPIVHYSDLGVITCTMAIFLNGMALIFN